MKTSLTSLTSFASSLIALAMFANITPSSQAQTFVLPDEAAAHEGTWLQWPHAFTYGTAYRNSLDATWVAMTKALVGGEKVHIIAYNTTEQTRIKSLLTRAAVPQTNVTFLIRQTNDVWVRDNGPLFVREILTNRMVITDWGFNGWGFDTPYRKDDTVPTAVASRGFGRVDVNDIVLEGGALVHDGHGTFMATRSSILEPNRNPGLTAGTLNAELADLFGARKVIWLEGAPGGDEDITDMHVDGFACFAPGRKLVTMSPADLAYWGVPAGDIATLANVTDVDGVPYSRLNLPLTARSVVTTSGKNLGYKGSYVNYYVGNKVVLVPAYNDPNDAIARNLLAPLFPGRTMVALDVRNLYENGGMVHCVTQPQPR